VRGTDQSKAPRFDPTNTRVLFRFTMSACRPWQTNGSALKLQVKAIGAAGGQSGWTFNAIHKRPSFVHAAIALFTSSPSWFPLSCPLSNCGCASRWLLALRVDNLDRCRVSPFRSGPARIVEELASAFFGAELF
jgi:hypothetical protein